MQLRYQKTVVPATESMCKVTAIAWSANNLKLAVVTVDRVVHLFDDNGERQDKFSTKPTDKGPKNYVVRSLAFSPDSTKLAVAQSDNIVFIYKLGSEWGEKKSICNKFHQQSPITCLVWPASHPNEVVFGLAEGKVKIGQLKSNKPAGLYSTESYVASLCSNSKGTAILSGHLDGSIYRFFFDDAHNGTGPSHHKFAHHSCVPYSLAWGHSIVAGGNDSRVVFYNDDGAMERTFDYGSETKVKEFSVACFNPTGESVVLGNFNSFYIYSYNTRQRSWEEVGIREVENMYSVTALAWKADGSKLVVGALCGLVDMYDACVRRYRYNGKFEFTYVSLSQVIVKRLSAGTRIVLKSGFGCEITKINIFQDRFLVANTVETLLCADLETCKLSEVPWQSSGSEKYLFENPAVCTVYRAGELALVEYGKNEMIGSVRTEYISAHLLSVRINERPRRVVGRDRDGQAILEDGENKKIAYLLDNQTVNVKDLFLNTTTTITHDSRVDWLELNGRANLLLFRDKRRQLHLYNLTLQKRTTLLNYCTYVQWVPDSDVCVAQNRGNMNVWYNINAPSKVTVYNIGGDVEDIERANGNTEVIVDEGMNTASYQLDENLINFGTAIDDLNFDKCMDILEGIRDPAEAEPMWTQLREVALEQDNLTVAERCAAALGDVARARYLHKVNKNVALAEKKFGGRGTDFWHVRAKLTQLRGDFRGAEDILLQQNQVEEAIEMYQTMHMWEEAILVAEQRAHPEAKEMRQSYYQYLTDDGQEEKAAQLKERQGEYITAINLYIKGGMPAKAAQVVNDHNVTQNRQLLDTVASALTASGMHDKAGEFFEKMDQLQSALESYTKGHAYRRAVELARRSFPGQVVRLEEAWGDWLVSQKQIDMAINHYIEANVHTKAIEAALNSRQWAKAGQLVDTIDPEVGKPYYRRLARHYQEARNLEEAEYYFVRAGFPQEAVEMYTRANKWEAAHKVAISYMTESEVSMLYISQAQRMEAQGKLKEAERLYLTVNEPDLAINMYKKQRKYEQMIRLVTAHRRDLLKDTHLHLAQQLEMEGNLREAEQHYVEAMEWLSAVNMYETNDMWDEAIRVAKYHGGMDASKRVAFAWAHKLGGEAGSKLLTKLGLTEPAVDYAIERGDFDYAFELARTCLPKKLGEVHLKHALFLEDEERFKEAEEEFVLAQKPKEAVDMYIHQLDWVNAQRVAEQCDPGSVGDVLVARGRHELEQKEYQRAESYFINAQKPELALNMYQDARMWSDATRVAKRHLPHKLNDVTLAYQLAVTGEGGNKDDLLAAARLAADSQQYSHAIDAYLNITAEMVENTEELDDIWQNAVRLSSAHVRDRLKEVTVEVARRLQMVQRFESAGELLKQADRVADAVDCFIRGAVWPKARQLAQLQAPDLLQTVEKAYKEHLLSSENAEELVEVGNVGQGLDLFAQKGEWVKVMEIASKQGKATAEKYAVRYAQQLVQDSDVDMAVSVLAEHGMPPTEANFPLYKQIISALLCRSFKHEEASREGMAVVLSNARSMLFKLVTTLKAAGGARKSVGEFEQLLLVMHYMANAHTARGHDLADLGAQMEVSLLRYCGTLPADKAFFKAGMACKGQEWQSLAFVLLNRYLDLTEAIDDGDASMLDNSDFVGTDVPSPFDSPLPTSQFKEEHEDVRDWVLALSMDPNVDQSLPTEPCVKCGTSIYSATLVCHNCKNQNHSCIVSGYPIPRGQGVECKNCGCRAIQQNWNRWLAAVHVCPWCSTTQSPVF